MTDPEGTVLRGLPGDNPLGFLAALGAQIVLSECDCDDRMHWTDDPIPYPVVSSALSAKEIASAVLVVSETWLAGPALDEAINPKLKLQPPRVREYLSRAREAEASGTLAMCLLAEDSLDNGGIAKPSDLYFTAGNQEFVSKARSILSDVSEQALIADMHEPWCYTAKGEYSLMWDVTDDRLHAHSAADPTSNLNRKFTNLGAEALAVIGLSRFPCFASSDRTLTQGCSGSWKRGVFVWPLWTVPATARSVRSLLAQVAAPEGSSSQRADWYRAWGLSRVMQSQIRRSPQGGYGTFGPPRVVWQYE